MIRMTGTENVKTDLEWHNFKISSCQNKVRNNSSGNGKTQVILIAGTWGVDKTSERKPGRAKLLILQLHLTPAVLGSNPGPVYEHWAMKISGEALYKYIPGKYKISGKRQLLLPLLCIRYANRIYISHLRRGNNSAVLRIRDPDPKFFHPGSASKNLSILTQKKQVSKLSEIWSGLCITDPDFYLSQIPDSGVKKGPVPRCQKGTGSRIRIPNTAIQSPLERKSARTVVLSTPWWVPQSWIRWWRWDTPSWSAPCFATGRWTPRSRRRTPCDRCSPLQTEEVNVRKSCSKNATK